MKVLIDRMVGRYKVKGGYTTATEAGLGRVGSLFSLASSSTEECSFPVKTRGEKLPPLPPSLKLDATESLLPREREVGPSAEESFELCLILKRFGTIEADITCEAWCSGSSNVKLAKEWVMLVEDGFSNI